MRILVTDILHTVASEIILYIVKQDMVPDKKVKIYHTRSDFSSEFGSSRLKPRQPYLLRRSSYLNAHWLKRVTCSVSSNDGQLHVPAWVMTTAHATSAYSVYKQKPMSCTIDSTRYALA